MANGFFYSVKAIVDKASFEQGRAELAKLEQTSKKLIVGIAGAATALTGMATIAGNVAQQEMKVAHSVGMSTTALASWKTACNIAGASANGLISALGSLEIKMQHLKTGQVDTGLAKNLGMLGIGYGDFAEMDSESRMRAVFNSAGQMEDQRLAAVLIGDTLGPAAKEYYESLKLSGKSLEQQLREAKQLNFVSEQNRKEAAIFASEFNSVKEAGKSITMLIGSEIGSALTPTVRKLKNYLIENKNAIVKGITGVVSQVSGVFKGITGAIEKVVPYVQGLIDKFGGLDQVIVKVGIGFAAIKLTQFAGGIAGIISSVNLLKAALSGIGKGLLVGGIFAVLQSLLYFFDGKDNTHSILEVIIPKIKELSKAMGFDESFENFKNSLKSLGESFTKLIDALGGKDAVVKGIASISTAIAGFAIERLTSLVDVLSSLVGIIDGLVSADFNKVAENIKLLGTATGEFIFGKTSTDLQKSFNEKGAFGLWDFGGVIWGAMMGDEDAKKTLSDYLWNATSKKTPPKKEGNKKTVSTTSVSQPTAYDLKNKYRNGSMQDGILSPNGKITQVSPQDWVFAVKNVDDLARAFLPNNINSSTSNSIIVNQTFNVESQDMAQTVKVSAFNGVQDALKNAYKQSSSFIQQMPGVR
jgi:hypothetical protein